VQPKHQIYCDAEFAGSVCPEGLYFIAKMLIFRIKTSRIPLFATATSDALAIAVQEYGDA
jgi:hypothetical protein